MIGVIAETQKHYRDYLRSKKLDSRNHRHIQEIRHLRGQRFEDIVTVGSYWRMKIFKEINLSEIKKIFIKREG